MAMVTLSARATATARKVAKKTVSERNIAILPSGNSDHTHHAALLVLQDVAVEHPIAGVVGDERNLHFLTGRHQHRIPPFPQAGRDTVTAEDAERMPVQMHRVPPGRLVVEGKNVRAASVEDEHRIHDVAEHGDAINEPDLAGVHHLHHVHHAAHTTTALAHHHATHHPAVEGHLVALGGLNIGLRNGVGGQW